MEGGSALPGPGVVAGPVVFVAASARARHAVAIGVRVKGAAGVRARNLEALATGPVIETASTRRPWAFDIRVGTRTPPPLEGPAALGTPHRRVPIFTASQIVLEATGPVAALKATFRAQTLRDSTLGAASVRAHVLAVPPIEAAGAAASNAVAVAPNALKYVIFVDAIAFAGMVAASVGFATGSAAHDFGTTVAHPVESTAVLGTASGARLVAVPVVFVAARPGAGDVATNGSLTLENTSGVSADLR
jgi:hypothetical protein